MFSFEPKRPCYLDPDPDDLERLSNGARDLIECGRLEEAERICLELKTRFPGQIDWIDHTAAVCEARGQVARAIEFYRRCLTHIDRHPGFDADSKE